MDKGNKCMDCYGKVLNVSYSILLICLIISCSRQMMENAKYSDNIRNEAKPQNAIRSKSDIWKQVEPVTYELKRIYENSYQAGKRPKGEIRVKFAVDAYGKIIFFEKLNSSFENTDFEKKIIDRLKRISFPDVSMINSADVTEVIFPFIFSE